jgi:putative ABC transport system permease protein
MSALALIRIALKALLRNRMRTFLSVLGIVIGVAAVITMVAIGQGSKESIRAQIGSMGANLVMIMPNQRSSGGVRLNASEVKLMELDDIKAIRAQSQYIADLSPVASAGGQAISGQGNRNVALTGVYPSYLAIRNYEIADGVMFTGENSMAKVCVLGTTTAKELFPDGSSPIGQTIRHKNMPLKVIGVLKAKGASGMGQDQDDVILAPFQTVQKRVLATTTIFSIFATARTEADAPAAATEVNQILTARRDLPETDESFSIRTQQEILEMVTSTSDMLTVLLSAIAGISLFVGGIGIMNIMYVSVTERTREIGLRMAIGARGRDILMQFLFESILISLTGGLIGILLGMGASYAVKLISSWPISVSFTSIAVSFGVCFATGVFFGWYPARKASRLDPIEALRYE